MADPRTRHDRLHRLLRPRSIVFVGGSATEPAITYARALGFKGRLSVINPRRDEIAGITCVRCAAELPEPVDAAFVAVPNEATADAVRDLAQAGVGAAVVSSSGFAEIGRQDLQDAVVAAAGDMPIIGPNSPGLANFIDGVAVMLDNMGLASSERGVAVLSNGGAYMADLACSDRSLPLALIVGLGNQSQVTIADMIDVVLDDDRITAINLYFESLQDVARLSAVARRAQEKGIPIVALKAGRTRAGARAAESHTAAIAGDAAIASALFQRLGFIEVESSSEAMETLKMFSLTTLPTGRRVGFATSSGTYAAPGADAAEQEGLVLPALPETQAQVLQPLMESFVTPNNPLDLATAQFWPDDDQRRLFDTFLASGFDIALQCMSFPAEGTWEDESWYRSSAIFAEAARAAALPAVFVSPTHEGLPRKAREMLSRLGVAPLQGFHDGLRAVAHAVHYAEGRGKNPNDMALPVPATPAGPATAMDEAAAKAQLRESGLPVPESRVWAKGDPPDGLTYPVALKLCHAHVTHKSDVGGVALGLAGPEDLQAARQAMVVAAKIKGIRAERFLVEEMIGGGVAELLVGIRHVPNIGQALTIASGGVATELLGDAATLLLPASRREMETAMESLKLFPLLNGWRGRTKADLAAAMDAIQSLCAFAEANRERLLELEINPLILRGEGRGVCAADAVLKLAGKEPK